MEGSAIATMSNYMKKLFTRLPKAVAIAVSCEQEKSWS